MTREDIIPEPPLHRDAWPALAALDALIKRIDAANDLHAVFTIKDSVEFTHAKTVVVKMEARRDRN